MKASFSASLRLVLVYPMLCGRKEGRKEPYSNAAWCSYFEAGLPQPIPLLKFSAFHHDYCHNTLQLAIDMNISNFRAPVVNGREKLQQGVHISNSTTTCRKYPTSPDLTSETEPEITVPLQGKRSPQHFMLLLRRALSYGITIAVQIVG